MRSYCYDCGAMVTKKTRHPSLEVRTGWTIEYFCNKCGVRAQRKFWERRHVWREIDPKEKNVRK